MKLPSSVFALLVSLLTPAETALEKKDQRGWSTEVAQRPTVILDLFSQLRERCVEFVKILFECLLTIRRLTTRLRVAAGLVQTAQK